MTLDHDMKVRLAKLLREYKDILYGKFGMVNGVMVTKRLRHETWDKIYAELEPYGLSVSKDHLRKIEADSLRRGARDRYEATKKSGAKGGMLKEFDEIMLDVIGRDPPHIAGLGVRDVPVSFQTAARGDDTTQPIDMSGVDDFVDYTLSQTHDDSDDLMPPPRARNAMLGERPSTSLVRPNFPPRSSTPNPGSSQRSIQSLPQIDAIRRTHVGPLDDGASQSQFDEADTLNGQARINIEAGLNRPRGLKRKKGPESLLLDDDFKVLKKDVLLLQKEKLALDKMEQELRIRKLEQSIAHDNEVFKLEVDAKQAQIERDIAAKNFYNSADRAFQDKNVVVYLQSDGLFTFIIQICKGNILFGIIYIT